ncbi:TetR/AcrR family transcriptional regulator [Silvibacterium sp.]|uniref:TetR/AcrR family transcriptional regulator n=1 Tax=Silvibacterium sp. TaxID=1964179 RepID=UPI0039E639C2
MMTVRFPPVRECPLLTTSSLCSYVPSFSLSPTAGPAEANWRYRDKYFNFCQNVYMPLKATKVKIEARRRTILQAAQWCFLNFGFGKTTFDDIAKRANLSRTLLYKQFTDKEAIFTAVFENWLVAKQPAARQAATGKESRYRRLLAVCRIMVLEPWKDMFGAPMAGEFQDVCERLDPEIAQAHRTVTLDCITSILTDASVAEVFLLALDGLLADEPSVTALDARMQLLVERFASDSSRKVAK